MEEDQQWAKGDLAGGFPVTLLPHAAILNGLWGRQAKDWITGGNF